MIRPPLTLAFTLASAASLAACQTTGTAKTAEKPPLAPAFVEAACGGCHGVEPPFFSPNPRAPSFADMATRKGVGDGPLAKWLSNAHNYPEDMEFDLTAEQIDQIVAYMVTLRDRQTDAAK
jgi:mono/diheme cytochrome c family protein